MWALYNRALDTSPILTKSFTSFSGFIIGDTLAQVYAGAGRAGGEKFDYGRTARFAVFGFCIHAPCCHYFYRALDKVVFPLAPKSPQAVLAKIAIDQLMWTPVATVLFYASLKTMEGEAHKIKETLQEKFVKTLLAGYALWPIAHAINFRFIPNKQRVLYINVVQVCWNIILCRIASSSAPVRKSKVEDLEHARSV
ncbi:hypothetical protein WJX72_003457 [[Myrmecia] bisecta]|uniref:Uncharacterized protein n=1 Tax=[Myrmecia] bisecta TaxID=41462 RepID=A0AAW1QEW4_9CHLO